jgi:hypothetical protein
LYRNIEVNGSYGAWLQLSSVETTIAARWIMDRE